MNHHTLFPVVILAGGLATRLRPLTHTQPKALIEVNGEPFIAHQLRLLYQHGIRDVVVCLGYLGEQIIDAVGDGQQFGVTVSYSQDGPVLLGTAGAIKNAFPLLGEHFFVLYGDSYLPCHYAAAQQAFLQSQKTALMTVFFNQGQWDTSNVEFNHGTIYAYDKHNRTERMHYIDYGLGVFNKAAFAHLPTDKPSDLACLYQELLTQQQLAALEVKERFYEVGSFSGIEELRCFLAEQDRQLSSSTI
jgi:N-acetyl-alpha-D-muramate 1-phosphate uridylyltransferase